jgi:hypothetical protein
VAFTDNRMPAAHQIISTQPDRLHEDAGEERLRGNRSKNHIFMQVCVNGKRPIIDLLGCLEDSVRLTMRLTMLLAVACLGISPASAGLIHFTFDQSVAGLLESSPSAATTVIWMAQFDVASHPTQPFTTPSNVTFPFIALSLPTINWSGDRIVSIVDASVHDTLTGFSWIVLQGPGFFPGTSQCTQPCSDSAMGAQLWGLSTNNGDVTASTLDTWSGVAVAGGAPGGVPEPGSFGLALLGGLALVMKPYRRYPRR